MKGYKLFEIVNRASGKVTDTRKTLAGARSCRDKSDAKEGRVCHSIRPVK